jgi:hypothetical protein
MKKFILGFIAFIAVIPLQGQSKKSIKNDIQASIERQKEKLIDISYAIWEAAETSLEEFTSSKLLMDYARENVLRLQKMWLIFLQLLWQAMARGNQ